LLLLLQGGRYLISFRDFERLLNTMLFFRAKMNVLPLSRLPPCLCCMILLCLRSDCITRAFCYVTHDCADLSPVRKLHGLRGTRARQPVETCRMATSHCPYLRGSPSHPLVDCPALRSHPFLLSLPQLRELHSNIQFTEHPQMNMYITP
jgi:hypothetical protein